MNAETLEISPELEPPARTVRREVDAFVRSRPYLTALGTIAIGAALAYSLKKEHKRSRFGMLTDALDKLKGSLETARGELAYSTRHATGRVSSGFGHAMKSARRLI